MGEFRIKNLPKDESSMKSIIDEIQAREGSEHAEEGHEHSHDHGHEHGHGGMDLGDALIHTMDHVLGQMAQIDERVARVNRSLEDISRDIGEVKNLLRLLVKIQLASVTDNREIRKMLISDVLKDLER